MPASSSGAESGELAAAKRFRRLASAFAAKLEAVPPDMWDAPTPCSDWNVRDLVGHVVAMAEVHLSRVGRTPRPGPDVNVDPVGAFKHFHDQVQAGLDDPQGAQSIFDGRFGRWTFAEAIDRAICPDLVVHGWDVARATGQNDRIDAADIAHVWHVVDLVGEEALRFGYAPAIPPPAGADEQARLLAHLGRAG